MAKDCLFYIIKFSKPFSQKDYKMKKESNFMQQNDDSNQNENNQSCPTVMEQDITMSRNQRPMVRIAKSQQIKATDRQKFQQMNQYQQQQYKKQTKKILGIPSSQSEIRTALNYKKGTDFDCEKVQSMQFSCDQQSYHSNSRKKGSQILLEQQNQSPIRKNKRNKQPWNNNYMMKNQDEIKLQIPNTKQHILNILVAGGQDTGKTTFIRCFQQRSRKFDQLYIRQRTKKIKYEGGINQNIGDKKNEIYFIDMPGFLENQTDIYVNNVRQYANQQWQNVANNEQDTRIHCCLYFFRGPRIKASDLKVMKKLSQYFSLIPILAKSDHYTVQQILQIKHKFLEITQRQRFNFYGIKQYLELKFSKQRVDFINKSKLGPIPPFAISSSQTKQDGQNGGFIRKYPWGKLQVQNQDHTQFQKLNNIITNFIKKDLIIRLKKPVQMVQSEQQVQNQQQLHEQLQNNQIYQQNQINWSNGIFMTTFVIGLAWVCYKYNNK